MIAKSRLLSSAEPLFWKIQRFRISRTTNQFSKRQLSFSVDFYSWSSCGTAWKSSYLHRFESSDGSCKHDPTMEFFDPIEFKKIQCWATSAATSALQLGPANRGNKKRSPMGTSLRLRCVLCLLVCSGCSRLFSHAPDTFVWYARQYVYPRVCWCHWFW